MTDFGNVNPSGCIAVEFSLSHELIFGACPHAWGYFRPSLSWFSGHKFSFAQAYRFCIVNCSLLPFSCTKVLNTTHAPVWFLFHVRRNAISNTFVMSENTLSEVPTRRDELPADLLALRTSNAEKGVNILAQTPSRPYSYREDEAAYDRFTPARKRLITAIVSFAGLGINLASLLVLSALPEVATAFNTTGTIINFTNALFLLMMGIGVLFWGPLSQVYGRKWVSTITFVFPAVMYYSHNQFYSTHSVLAFAQLN